MKTVTYIVTIKGVLAAAQAAGYDGTTILYECDLWAFIKETSRIAYSGGVEIRWIIRDQ